MSNGKVVIDLSITLDGYIAGSNDSVAQPLGDGVRLFGDGNADERETDKGERGALKAITLTTP